MQIKIDFDSGSFVKWAFLSFATIVGTKLLFVLAAAIFMPHAGAENLIGASFYLEQLVSCLFIDVVVAIMTAVCITACKWSWKGVVFLSLVAVAAWAAAAIALPA